MANRVKEAWARGETVIAGWLVGKVLDAGAMGVICPMINTPEKAGTLVAAMRYPSHGTGSHGPIRAGIYGEVGTYYKTANADVVCVPMIETVQAPSPTSTRSWTCRAATPSTWGRAISACRWACRRRSAARSRRS